MCARATVALAFRRARACFVRCMEIRSQCVFVLFVRRGLVVVIFLYDTRCMYKREFDLVLCARTHIQGHV